MTITLTPQELETVYLALNNYSLSYIRMSRTWANLKPNGPDAAEQKPRDPREVRRNWIALLIGIPAFIGAILLIVYLFRTITSA